MRFESYFKASSYCTICAGFLAIVSTGTFHWLPVSLFVFALIAGWFIDTARLHTRFPLWLQNCLSIAYLFFFAADFLWISRSFLIAAMHLILFASILKLLTLSKNRDYFFLYVISFTQILAASTLTANLAFGFCFLVFLISGIQTFILFEMRRSNDSIQKKISVRPFVVPRDRRGSGLDLFSPFSFKLLSGMTAGISLMIVLVALPLFFLLPRVASGFRRQPSGKTQFVSGFSESVELGRAGSILQSDTIVMRVRTSFPPERLPLDLKWRGMAFDHYDGRAWKRSRPIQDPVPIQEGHFKLENTITGPDLLQQSFFLEALSTNVVFAAHKALAVSPETGSLERDDADNLFTQDHTRRKLSYNAISELSRLNTDYIYDNPTFPVEIEEKYLQLPALDTRIGDLARQATSSVDGNYQKAQALEQFLRTQYNYSLEMTGTPGSEDPLAMFLFDTRKGHCEYFASAMAIMLRQIGIPSRLVNGFRNGEYNRIGDNWIVRQYHAHSWVEAYFPPNGWIEFDPTPAQPPASRTTLARLWSDVFDAADLWWWERIVNYNASSQYNVVASLHYKSGKLLDILRNTFVHYYEKCRKALAEFVSPKTGPSLISVLVWVLLLLVAAFLIFCLLRKRILKRIRPVLYRNRPQLYAGSFYAEALEMLSRYGMVRAPGQTPLEFAQSLENHPARAPLTELTRLYNIFRFGNPDTIPRSLEAELLLQSLRGSLKNG